jgi:integrase
MKLSKNINHPVKGSSIKVEPIKDEKHIKAIEDLLADDPRNLALFSLGINTSLRVTDLLKIKAGQVQDINKSKEIKFKNSRSGKVVKVPLNKSGIAAVKQLIRSKEKRNEEDVNPDDFLFTGYRKIPLTVPYVNNLIKK